MEKPLALTVEDCRRIGDAVEREGIRLFTAFKMRYYPMVQKARELIPDPLMVVMQMMDNRWGDTWANDPVLGGGNVYSQGCHSCDLLRYVAGSDPEEVYAAGGNYYQANGRLDNLTATFRFENGAAGCWIQGDANQPAMTSKLFMEIFSENRSALLTDRFCTLTYTETGKEPVVYRGEEGGFVEENRLFVEALQTGAPMAADHVDGLMATLMMIQAGRSVESRRPGARRVACQGLMRPYRVRGFLNVLINSITGNNREVNAMKEHRHPHPHKDPRQPGDGARPGNEPSGLCVAADRGRGRAIGCEVARDSSGFENTCLDVGGLQEPLYLPETGVWIRGMYFWRWSLDSGATSEVFAFEIEPEAVVVEVPPAAEWLKGFPAEHPRIYVRPEELPALRSSAAGEQAQAWARLRESAEAVLAEPHEIEEPPFLPDRSENYQKYHETWAPIMWNSRRFVKGAETLGLAYLVSGEDVFARAACRRMASISRWDPEGSSHLPHNDEAHMSVIWNGSNACDWVWDRFTEQEREAVVAQFRRRGQITFDHMHNRGSYGVTRFDSHAGREIVFLAHIALVFHEHIPEAQSWLEWLRPVLCGIWPIWSGDDGAWAEGPSYGLAYVTIMSMFATALKRGIGVDLYRRPFWKNHARWRQYCLPPYAEWMGFGDHTERWAGTWRSNADLVDLIGHETDTSEFTEYVKAFRAEAEEMQTPAERRSSGVLSQLYLAGPEQTRPPSDTDGTNLRVFPAAGWAAVRTHLNDPARDIAMIFRSSPLGAISHSHANNNDFILHAGRQGDGDAQRCITSGTVRTITRTGYGTRSRITV